MKPVLTETVKKERALGYEIDIEIMSHSMSGNVWVEGLRGEESELEFFIKWDGCSTLNWDDHWCDGYEWARRIQLLRWLWQYAARNIPSWNAADLEEAMARYSQS